MARKKTEKAEEVKRSDAFKPRSVYYELCEDAKKLSMDEITFIRGYIYKCCAGDDKLAGSLFVSCVTTNYAPDEVLELAKRGKPIDKDRLRVKIWYADYD